MNGCASVLASFFDFIHSIRILQSWKKIVHNNSYFLNIVINTEGDREQVSFYFPRFFRFTDPPKNRATDSPFDAIAAILHPMKKSEKLFLQAS